VIHYYKTKPIFQADDANEQIDPCIRTGDSAVMLSVAKYFDAQRDRPFAAAQGDSGGADFIIRSIFVTA